MLTFPVIIHAQELLFEQEQYPFPVTFYGVEPQLGFMAARSHYHPDFGDIDDDGDFDLIIGSNSGFEYFFENIGSDIYPEFQYSTNQYVITVDDYMYMPPLFCDIDNDDDMDLFISAFNGFVTFYENIGTPESAEYILSDTTFAGISTSGRSSLDFVDIDNDNDFDLFLGAGWSSESGRLYYFLNDGTPEIPDFTFVTDYFLEIDVGDDSAPEFCDINGDGDYDLFIGCEDGTVWYYENIGTPDSFNFEYVTDYYDNIDVGNMSVPRFCDIDGDGDFDLFVANESSGGAVGFTGDMDYYENIGTSLNPDFQFVTGQYLFMDMSGSASPYAIDIDDDGILELLTGITSGQIVLMENSGQPDDPSLYFAESAFCGLSLNYQPVLSFSDLDGDGDFDLIATRGGFNDYVDMYENTGNAANPQFAFWQNIASGDDWQGGGCDICDIDGDNDFDLFFCDGYNRIHYYKNIGDSLNPVFRFETENYLNQPYMGGYLFPRFNDIDHDGDFDLIMGQNYTDTYIIFWRNIGSAHNANFVIEDTLAYYEYPEVLSLRPCLGDIDGDGDDDMFVGEAGGAMLFFRNQEFSSVNRNPGSGNPTFALMPNYPNPFNAATTFSFNLQAASKIDLGVYDVLGRRVWGLGYRVWEAGPHEVVWNAEGVASGVYMIQLLVDSRQSMVSSEKQVRKVVLLK